jgi:hypothetical protein
MKETKNEVEKLKSGGQVADKSTGRRSKLHADHWKSRLFHDGATRANGERDLSADWSAGNEKSTSF